MAADSARVLGSGSIFKWTHYRVLEVFRRTYPGGKPVDLWNHIRLFEHRATVISEAVLKAAQNTAPAYLYLFAWKTPVFDGMPRSVPRQ